MIWPFKRKPKHVGPTSVDWKPGDMAKCVVNDFADHGEPCPKAGDQFMVTHVGTFLSTCGSNKGSTLIMLGFVGKENAYAQSGFRKITLTDTGADRKVAKRKPVGVDA